MIWLIAPLSIYQDGSLTILGTTKYPILPNWICKFAYDRKLDDLNLLVLEFSNKLVPFGEIPSVEDDDVNPPKAWWIRGLIWLKIAKPISIKSKIIL